MSPESNSGLFFGFQAIIFVLSILGAIHIITGICISGEDRDEVPDDANWLEEIPISMRMIFVGVVIYVICEILDRFSQHL